MTIESGLNNIENTKATIKQAIVNKGVSVPVSTTFAEYPTKIAQIETEPVLDTLTVTPSTTSQTLTPPSGVDGFDEVVVSAVTSGIDNNIQAGNIKKNVTILGVTGSYESGVTPMNTANVPREIDSQGKVGKPTTSFTWTLPNSVTSVETYAFYEALKSCTGLVGLDFSSLESISEAQALRSMCYLCPNLVSINFANLEVVDGQQALEGAFHNCSSLEEVEFPKLRIIGDLEEKNIGCFNTFNDCTSLRTMSFPKLEEIRVQSGFMAQGCTNLQSVSFPLLRYLGIGGLGGAFNGCTSLTTINFPSLALFGSSKVMQSTFYGCTSLTSVSFPALNSNSFVEASGRYTFNSMLGGVTGCTVHFPSNLESTISAWTTATNGFGGTNTTILFDLPATT